MRKEKESQPGDPKSIALWRTVNLSTGDAVIDQIRERVRTSILDRYDRKIDDKTAAHQMRGCEIDLGYRQAMQAGRALGLPPSRRIAENPL